MPHRNVEVPRISIGDVVTFSYESYSRKDEYVNPVITRIRTDVSWPEPVYTSISGHQITAASHTKALETGMRRNAKRFWTETTMREGLERIARKLLLDPLLPDTWYSLSPAAVAREEVYHHKPIDKNKEKKKRNL